MPSVDFHFISNFEGGQRLVGYVPDAQGSQSGVTVATGFDLGARNVTDLEGLGLSPALVGKLTKYLGKQRQEAERALLRYPLKIEKAEADTIDAASHKSILATLRTRYDAALPQRTSLKRFDQLPSEAQTVIASVSFQYGDLSSRTPNFWKAVTHQNWKDAVGELRDFGDHYSSRRHKEADLLAKMLNGGASKPVATPPVKPAAHPTSKPTSTPLLTYAYPVLDVPLWPHALADSVGQGGKNHRADVQYVARLLNAHLRAPMRAVRTDGVVDKGFIDSIVDFQRRAAGMNRPDGRIDPGGPTFHLLQGTSKNTVKPSVHPPATKVNPPSVQAPILHTPAASAQVASGFSFPFPTLPKKSWRTGPRVFGYPRDGGKRRHAACDLYFPAGTWIHAIADGTVIGGPYSFYNGTDALEVQHGPYVVRYGEIKPNSFVGGKTVKRGQRLCQVGHLVGISVESDMLHFEMYSGKATGPLTNKANAPYKRRKDLIDPTPFLDEWAAHLPSV